MKQTCHSSSHRQTTGAPSTAFPSTSQQSISGAALGGETILSTPTRSLAKESTSDEVVYTASSKPTTASGFASKLRASSAPVMGQPIPYSDYPGSGGYSYAQNGWQAERNPLVASDSSTTSPFHPTTSSPYSLSLTTDPALPRLPRTQPIGNPKEHRYVRESSEPLPRLPRSQPIGNEHRSVRQSSKPPPNRYLYRGDPRLNTSFEQRPTSPELGNVVDLRSWEPPFIRLTQESDYPQAYNPMPTGGYTMEQPNHDVGDGLAPGEHGQPPIEKPGPAKKGSSRWSDPQRRLEMDPAHMLARGNPSPVLKDYVERQYQEELDRLLEGRRVAAEQPELSRVERMRAKAEAKKKRERQRTLRPKYPFVDPDSEDDEVYAAMNPDQVEGGPVHKSRGAPRPIGRRRSNAVTTAPPELLDSMEVTWADEVEETSPASPRVIGGTGKDFLRAMDREDGESSPGESSQQESSGSETHREASFLGAAPGEAPFLEKTPPEASFVDDAPWESATMTLPWETKLMTEQEVFDMPSLTEGVPTLPKPYKGKENTPPFQIVKEQRKMHDAVERYRDEGTFRISHPSFPHGPPNHGPPNQGPTNHGPPNHDQPVGPEPRLFDDDELDRANKQLDRAIIQFEHTMDIGNRRLYWTEFHRAHAQLGQAWRQLRAVGWEPGNVYKRPSLHISEFVPGSGAWQPALEPIWPANWTSDLGAFFAADESSNASDGDSNGASDGDSDSSDYIRRKYGRESDEDSPLWDSDYDWEPCDSP
ncbi:hypothetical protein M011DRAFT_478911 [Sporormia fimetaria CBS 119925]|uniref:Uncharacterized protein n=1 Tax=Sporormia fimetaria CBS 119925 TaxID=1340428 RepID=A0A6A6V6Q1_9PLEO|nr:hypothetical protein M011DRAFT_478911 [Sporormia fimetaria CBS 119925]